MLKATACRLCRCPWAPAAGAASPGTAVCAAVGAIASSPSGLRVAFELQQRGAALWPPAGPPLLSLGSQ